MWNDIYFLITGASFATILFDLSLVGAAYATMGQIFIQSQSTLARRKLIAYVYITSQALGWTAGYYYSRLVLETIRNPWLLGLKILLDLGLQFSCYLGYALDMSAIYKYYLTGTSRFNTGIMDELVEGSHEAIKDYSRLHLVFLSVCFNVPIFALSYFLNK